MICFFFYVACAMECVKRLWSIMMGKDGVAVALCRVLLSIVGAAY